MKSVLLVCDGLDTVSRITVNDEVVGTSANMFVKYTYDIKPVVRVSYISELFIFMNGDMYILLFVWFNIFWNV